MLRHILRWSVAGMFLATATWWAAGAPPLQSPANQRTNRKMPDIVIATFPTEAAYVSGQSLPVRTYFENTSSKPAQAPSRDSASQFVYLLKSQRAETPEYSLSNHMTMMRRSPDRFTPEPPAFETVPAGEKVETLEDIADYWNEGFHPGKYVLTVRLPDANLDSPKSIVNILPMEVEGLSSFVTERQLSSVVAHRRTDGQISLFQRESDVTDPREGVFQYRLMLPKGGPVQVATAVTIAPSGNGRWFAYTRDGKLNASVGFGNKLLLTVPAIEAAGTLLSPGYQIAVGTGLFGVVSSQGRLTTYLATNAGLKPHWTANLEGATGKVRWNAQPDGTITIAWEDASTGRVARQAFSADGQAKADRQLVTPGRAVAWGLPAQGPPTVWMIGSPDGATFELARVPVEGERSLARLPAIKEVPTSWDFFDSGAGNSAVVAISGGRVVSSRLENPDFKTVSAEGSKALSPHVISLNGKTLWVEWAEPGFGIRRARLER